MNYKGWIPVTENLPETSGRYLVYHNGGIDISFFRVGKGFTKSKTADILTWHWMPLPEPPNY